MVLSSVTLLLLGFVLSTLVYTHWRNGDSLRARLPPGPPPGTPGSAKYQFLQFAQWSVQFGPIYTFWVGNQVRIVLGTYKAAVDILEKEGAATADRPTPAAATMMSNGMRFLLCPSGERHRRLRRAMHMHFQPKALQNYGPIQLINAKQLILDLLDDAEGHIDHAKRFSASVILSVGFGRPSPGLRKDPDIKDADDALNRFSQCFRPGVYLVNDYPWLRYVPFYGQTLRKYGRMELASFRRLVERVKKDMAQGTAPESVTRYLLDHQKEVELNDDEIAYFSGGLFAAGIDTTASGISFTIMAAALHPDAQAQVQAELDAVVGWDRLPSFSDLNALPHLTAFVEETLRWRPISAAGIQHKASEDIVYNGYVIPRGAAIAPNHWAISRDPDLFDDGDSFKPTRWFNTGTTDFRKDIVFPGFGFGRRVCPGEELAFRSLFITTALLLHSFEISPDPDRPIDTLDIFESVNIHPRHFAVKFNVRRPGGEDSLRDVLSL